jgi:DNA-binding NarL/FixJ family response regulator
MNAPFRHRTGGQTVDPAPTQDAPETADASTVGAMHGAGPSGEMTSVRRLVAIIEARQLFRECLVRCLQAMNSDEEVVSFASVDEWQEWFPHSGHSLEDVLILFNSSGLRDWGERFDRDFTNLRHSIGMVPIVIISDSDDPDYIAEAIDKGASGILPTSVSLSVAFGVMRLVRAGGIYVPASGVLASRRSSEYGSNGIHKRYNGLLTPRQAAVVEEIRRGKANKVISYELQMKESTVKVHIRNAMRKLGVRNRTELAILANNYLPHPCKPDRPPSPASMATAASDPRRGRALRD